MEPFAPESLSPGVLPDSGLQPVKVAQDRMAMEQKANQLKAAADAAKKAEAAKVKETFKEPDYSKVYFLHTQRASQKYSDLEKGLAQIEKNWADNPTNPEMNPDQEGTMANAQKKKLYFDQVQFVKNSEDIKERAAEIRKAYGTRTDIMPEYWEDVAAWETSDEALQGKANMPEPEMYWDKAKAYEDYFGKIKADKRATATAGGGYIDEKTVETITEPDIRNVAQSMATDRLAAANIQKEIDALGAAEKAALMEQSRQSGMTPVSQKFYNDNLYRTQRVETKNKSSDATFNNKMGSGWGSDMASMERLADEIINSGDLTSPHWRRFSGWYSGDAPQGYKGTPIGVNMGFNGLKVGKDDDGKDVFVTSTVDNGDGTISLIAQNDVTSKTAGVELMRMPAKDFANNIVNTIAENNTDIDREVLERVLKEKGAVTGEGFVKTKQASKTAQQMAEERRKASGSGKNTKAMD